MKKELNIGAMTLAIPDYSSDVGQILELMQNEYEAGNMRAAFVVYATKEKLNFAAVGDKMVLPFVTMVSHCVARRDLEDIDFALSGGMEREDGDED